MSKKNGKVAPPVEVKTQEKSEVPKDPLEEPIVISDKVRKQAQDFGIDVGKIVDTANLLRERVLGIEKSIMFIAKGLDDRDEKLAPLVRLAQDIEARRQAMPQGTPQAPQQGGGGGGLREAIRDIAPFLGSSEPDPLTKMFMQQVMRTGLESMALGNVLMKTYVLKVAPAEYAEAMRSVDKTMTKATEATGEK